jgi:hypothetical protein
MRVVDGSFVKCRGFIENVGLVDRLDSILLRNILDADGQSRLRAAGAGDHRFGNRRRDAGLLRRRICRKGF